MALAIGADRVVVPAEARHRPARSPPSPRPSSGSAGEVRLDARDQRRRCPAARAAPRAARRAAGRADRASRGRDRGRARRPAWRRSRRAAIRAAARRPAAGVVVGRARRRGSAAARSRSAPQPPRSRRSGRGRGRGRARRAGRDRSTAPARPPARPRRGAPGRAAPAPTGEAAAASTAMTIQRTIASVYGAGPRRRQAVMSRREDKVSRNRQRLPRAASRHRLPGAVRGWRQAVPRADLRRRRR